MADYNTRFGQFCARKSDEYGEKFDVSDLNPNFVQAYNRGQNYRVKVRTPEGSTVWGFVGVTTGWRPAFLLMRRRGQVGSSIVLGENYKIVDSKVMR